MLSRVVTSILSILSIFLQYFPINSINIFYLFRALQILGKWGSKLDKKRTSFSTLRAPVPTDLWFFIVFFLTEIHITQTQTRPLMHFYSLQIFFFNNLFLTFFFQNGTSKFVKVLLQKLNNSLLEKSLACFCAAVC